MFRILRNIFKYGDAFFIRDPETKRWFHVDPANVSRIIVNESQGKTPEQYIVKNVNLNFKDAVATTPHQTNGNVTGGGDGYLTGSVRGQVGAPNQSMSGGRFQKDVREIAIDAENMIHLSLSEGLDGNFPFGNSLLESIFKLLSTSISKTTPKKVKEKIQQSKNKIETTKRNTHSFVKDKSKQDINICF